MQATYRDHFPIGEATFWRDIFFSTAFQQRMYREALGCTVVDIVDQSGDAVSGLVLSVLAGVAEFERDLIRERTRAGLQRAVRAGKQLGRPPEKELDAAEIRQLRAEGKQWKEIAAELGTTVGAAKWKLATSEGRR